MKRKRSFKALITVTYAIAKCQLKFNECDSSNHNVIEKQDQAKFSLGLVSFSAACVHLSAFVSLVAKMYSLFTLHHDNIRSFFFCPIDCKHLICFLDMVYFTYKTHNKSQELFTILKVVFPTFRLYKNQQQENKTSHWHIFMVTEGQSEPWHIQRDAVHPNIPKHKCCTDVHDYCMRINGALGTLAAKGVWVLTMTSSV